MEVCMVSASLQNSSARLEDTMSFSSEGCKEEEGRRRGEKERKRKKERREGERRERRGEEKEKRREERQVGNSRSEKTRVR